MHRELILAAMAGMIAFSGCDQESLNITPTPIVRNAAPKPDQTQEMLVKIQKEVQRLAGTYPPDSFVNKVYLGNLSQLNPFFKSPVNIGIADPTEYAQISFINPKYSSNPRFRYFLDRDQSTADYRTLDQLDIAIAFSPAWLNSSDQVKALTMEKEASALPIWESFNQITLNTYLFQGKIEAIDPQITSLEIARTFGRQLLFESTTVQKLYDYAGYLAVLPKVGQLIKLQDPQINKDLFVSTNLGTIYRLAEQRKINFDLQFGSEEFLSLAFNIDGPWGRMIADPTIPSPPSPIH